MNINKNLLKGSLILFVSFGIFNVLNFAFQFFMVRLLSISDYGMLAAVFSIGYIFSIFSESIQLVIARYTSSEKNYGRLKNIMKRSIRRGINVSLMLFFAYLIISIFLAKLLNVPFLLLALNGLLIFYVFLIPVPRGIMQGEKSFGKLGFSLIVESLLKLIFAYLFVAVGWGVYGAVGAVILGGVGAFLVSLLTILQVLKSPEVQFATPRIYHYSGPLFIIVLIITAFYSLDVLIAKIVFDDVTAGYYAVASVLAKIIFWGTQPISKAMFPISAEDRAHNRGSKKVYFNALGMLSALVLITLVFFYFFPTLIVRVFSGDIIPQSAQVLFYLGIGTALLSLANLNLLYRLSLGEMKKAWIFGAFILLEVFLLFYFSGSLIQFSIAFISAAAAFLLGTIFLIRDEKTVSNHSST